MCIMEIPAEEKRAGTKIGRNTKKYLFNGEIKSLGEIAEILGINYKLLHQKLNRDKKSLGGFEFKETK